MRALIRFLSEWFTGRSNCYDWTTGGDIPLPLLARRAGIRLEKTVATGGKP